MLLYYNDASKVDNQTVLLQILQRTNRYNEIVMLYMSNSYDAADHPRRRRR